MKNDPPTLSGRSPGHVYLSPANVAKLLSLSPKTIAALARNDPTMPVTRIGRTVRFDEAAFYRWLASKTSRTRALPPFPSTGSMETRLRALLDAAQSLATDHRRMSRND
jgi:excisionase family DNA binding protein